MSELNVESTVVRMPTRLTLEEAAKLARVHPVTIRRAALRGEVRLIRLGRRKLFITEDELRVWMNGTPLAVAG